MDLITLGEIVLQRIAETPEFLLAPAEVLAEATPDALAPHRHWLEPTALCPETGRLIFPVNSYLVRTSRHTILIDTCVGCDKSHTWYKPWHKRSDTTWLARLSAAGGHPHEIDYVFCTHLHVDHCGWNTRLVEGRWVPTFPNARYVFSRTEFEHSQSEADSTFLENVAPIMEAGQGVLVDMDHALDDEVWLEPTPGHTPGHVAVHLASRGRAAVMCGDLIHSPLQCAHPRWASSFDLDTDLAGETRHGFLDANCDTDTLVLTAHFPAPSVGHVVAKDDAFRFDYL